MKLEVNWEYPAISWKHHRFYRLRPMTSHRLKSRIYVACWQRKNFASTHECIPLIHNKMRKGMSKLYHLFKNIWHIEAETRWPPFYRRQMHFIEWKYINFDWYFTLRRPGETPLSGTMVNGLLTHICVTPPQWVKGFKMLLLLTKEICHLYYIFAKYEQKCSMLTWILLQWKVSHMTKHSLSSVAMIKSFN